jgi:acetoin utilization deacetylase AcuC-like enzyme
VRDLCKGRGDVPLLVLGGGGYNSTNAARAFTHFTSLLLDKVLPSEHDAGADDDDAREGEITVTVCVFRDSPCV